MILFCYLCRKIVKLSGYGAENRQAQAALLLDKRGG